MRPGEIMTEDGDIELNVGRATVTISVKNLGDRPIQVGSHFHFFEVNKFLSFPRDKAYGMRLDIPSGTSVRFEPGEEREVTLVELGGSKRAFGANNLTCARADETTLKRSLFNAYVRGFRGAKWGAEE